MKLTVLDINVTVTILWSILMKTFIDLKNTPVFDAHCFAYDDGALTEDMMTSQYAMIGPSPSYMSEKQRESRVAELALTTGALNKRINDLAKHLSCEPNITALVTEREKRRKDNFPEYVKGLIDDISLKGMGVDTALFSLEDADNFGKTFPGFIKKTFRLTTLVKDLLNNSTSFENLISDYDDAMTDAVKNHGCIAFKSIIAYRTGLDIKQVSESDAKASFDNRKNEPTWYGYKAKALRDFLIRRSLVNCIKLDATFMIHTGLGDSDIVAMECRPLMLWNLLTQDELMECNVMLIHGGFPFTEEATYISNVLPNVYFDLSAGTGPAFLEKAVSPERFTDVLRSVPNSKVIYSSDGGEGGPETLWHDCVTAKSAAGHALGTLVDEGIYSETTAKAIGEDIFYNNSKRLFKF